MVSLGTLSGGTTSFARGISADGQVIVGGSDTTIAPSGQRGFRWTASTGMLSVEDWLRANGVSVAADFSSEATATNADGSVVVGQTQAGTAFIARVAPPNVPGAAGPGTPGAGSGMIDLAAYAATLAAKPTGEVGSNLASTVMDGAHGQPMRNLLAPGQQSAWVTTDVGYDDDRGTRGGFGIADFGYGIGLGDGLTARMAGGGIYTRQTISTGGDFNYKGVYFAPEISVPMAGSLYATIGGYYAPGSISINRNYLNAGFADQSRGTASLNTWGAKVRLDWLDAFTLGRASFTPYASLSHTQARIGAYTETGGGFPASFNATTDRATVARLGLDMIQPISENFRLKARAEVAYQFEKNAAPVTGTIIGLTGFQFTGRANQQVWARGSIGAEVDVGGGIASFDINASTSGRDPSVWLRTGWKVTF